MQFAATGSAEKSLKFYGKCKKVKDMSMSFIQKSLHSSFCDILNRWQMPANKMGREKIMPTYILMCIYACAHPHVCIVGQEVPFK